MDALKDLKWLLIILVVLWFIWFATGGRMHKASTSGPFLNPPAPLDNGGAYGPQFLD